MAIVRWIEKLTKLAGYLGALLVIPLTFVIVYEIVQRNLFNRVTMWSFDVSWMLFGIMFLLGGAYTLQTDRHIRVDVIVSAFPPIVRKGIDLFFFIFIFLPLTGIMTWRGYIYASLSWTTNEMLSTSMFVFPAWVSKVFIPICFALLFLQGIAYVARNIFDNTEKAE